MRAAVQKTPVIFEAGFRINKACRFLPGMGIYASEDDV